MFEAFLNTLYITVPATILPLILASLAAYAFAWVKFPFRDTLFLAIIALLLVPLQMTLIPLSRLFRDLGLIGTFWPIWIIHTTFALPFGIFLLRNFFITLPKDLIEAARIDGASTFGIFRKIVLPLSVPALASYAIFQFLWVWNDLLVALVFAPRPAGLPMTTQVGAAARHVRRGVGHPGGGVVPDHDRAAGRLLQPPALLRSGSAGRIRQVASLDIDEGAA